MTETRNTWLPNAPMIPHILTPIEREEWEERSAIIEESTGEEKWVANLEAAKICVARWSGKK